MDDYSFDDFKRDLRIGHEIELCYKGQIYVVAYSPYDSSERILLFYKAYDEESILEYKSTEEFLQRGSINGNKLEDLWEDIVVEMIF
ncbi:hypothetical protein [Marininema halotolerans]|uniref:Uncharacterized protein n=1 Tax=Marininema halotolerans TaxID=1155944 RepID=A0A1I6UN65_9BACL|nr:hypothetical protein [Marininema halotolerans]SFT02902.1 hypothetical protein SAMN05444972_11846 [Marininema halotolerans]